MCRERKVGFTQGFRRFISYLWTKMQAYAIKRKYTLYVLCMLLLCLLLIASLAVSVFWGSNLSQLLVSVEPKLEPAVYLVRGIINLDAVLKMGEAVGICSFLIAWVYASLDKKELGFRYSELLVELYPGYHRFVLLHLVAFLVCIWMTKTEKLEAAVLSLTIVLAESVLQWNTLKNLILFSEKRMKIALDRWNWLIDENSQKPNDELLVTINNIADALIFDVNSCYENMLHILSRAIAKYIDSCPKLFDKEEEYVRTLWEISRIWDRVLSGKSQSDRELLLVGLLRHSIRNFSRGNVLCVGYLLWFYNTLIEQGITNDAALAELDREVAMLTKQHFTHSNYSYRIPFYMEAAFTLLVWMHFMCGNIQLDSDLFKLAPSEHPTQADKELLRGFARTVFDEAACGQYLELAVRVMF